MADESGYIQEYLRPPHPTCDEEGCDRKVKVEVIGAGGVWIGGFCQSDGLKALREHNRTLGVGTIAATKEGDRA